MKYIYINPRMIAAIWRICGCVTYHIVLQPEFYRPQEVTNCTRDLVAADAKEDVVEVVRVVDHVSSGPWLCSSR